MSTGKTTSEFQLTGVVIVAAFVLALAGKVDGDAALTAITVASGAYSASRGIAKRGGG